MNEARLMQLEHLLRVHGDLTAQQIRRALGVSQPTVSRLLAHLGSRAGNGLVLHVGQARASRYVLARAVARAGSDWPLYRLDTDGMTRTLGRLHALHGGGFLFRPTSQIPEALLHGEFAQGLFPGLPWFLDDLRPQGFLGRAFARRFAADLNAPTDLLHWQCEDVLLALLRHGEDLPGDLVLGEAALLRAQQTALAPVDAIDPAQRASRYSQWADAALRGEAIGSSAAGEQPKFTALLREGGKIGSATDRPGYRAVIVKFSARSPDPVARRWADLLRAEHLAAGVLHKYGLEAAPTDLITADGRVFLQSTRFDRTPVLGRRGLVTLAALDGAFHGHGRIDWWRYAEQLRREGWISDADARRLALTGWFGALIGNSDMHLGNVALILDDTRPLALAPIYDMLPMQLRPTAGGEIIAHGIAILLPTPEWRDDWHQAARMALAFWQQVSQQPDMTPDFARIAIQTAAAIQTARARV